MWESIRYVSSGLALLAFIAAVGAWVYRFHVLRIERRIQLAPESERTRLLERTLVHFDVDTSRLTREQRYEIVIKQIETRALRARMAAVVIALFTLTSGVIAVYSTWRGTGTTEAIRSSAAEQLLNAGEQVRLRKTGPTSRKASPLGDSLNYYSSRRGVIHIPPEMRGLSVYTLREARSFTAFSLPCHPPPLSEPRLLICPFRIQNNGSSDKFIALVSEESFGIDENGVDHPAVTVHLGRSYDRTVVRNRIPPDTYLAGQVVLDGFSSPLPHEVSLLRVRFLVRDSPGFYLMDFRSVPIR